MKKNIIKKLFIRISKILGYELIDQNEFYSPTLEKKLDEDLSNKKKSIIVPLGEVKLTRKITSLLIIFRTNTNVNIWDQNKKRIFEYPKIDYATRSLNSLLKSVNFLKKKYHNIEIDIKIINENTNEEDLKKFKNISQTQQINVEIINHDCNEHKTIIKDQNNNETFSNLSSLLKCFEIGKKNGKDLVYFVEDDYLHFDYALEEMISTYERVSSQLNKEIFICPSDYPYFYMNNEKTNLLIGTKRHWRTITKTLCTFMTSIKFIEIYWENFYNNCLQRHDPFEKYLNKIYEKEICISPIKSLSVHLTNVNSSYGLSPFINYKKLWDENE
tara:strand:- start:51 stop:1037 length:987 start_codon:yes stop_codon:yes gene_type:complete